MIENLNEGLLTTFKSQKANKDGLEVKLFQNQNESLFNSMGQNGSLLRLYRNMLHGLFDKLNANDIHICWGFVLLFITSSEPRGKNFVFYKSQVLRKSLSEEKLHYLLSDMYQS